MQPYQQLAMPFPAEPSRRLFVGLQPDTATQRAIAAWRDGWAWAARPSLVPAERLHITLFFLGEVATRDEPALRQALAATPMPPLSLALRTPAVWRNGVAVLLPDEHAGLRAQRERMRQSLQRHGFACGADWQPHLTLARKAAGARPPAGPAGFAFTLYEFALVWSQLPPLVPAARHVVLARYPAGVPPVN
ncbi:2'-5' RNA ligase family protein [Ramlibacter tataouinensis]|uniref:RNA 2',3'-cyclic phosphodiesterase n=1 Tax=Ramlibacter tataouinensis (strain ATCC BAA-407 / DSM 14655 / LMG 21543 / TTB310) TaxID=365046 RepID=F5Y4S7_RAMTT|nr:2'-5' RNA ligase family protein [Ramlibacter tataouinensis]AEG92583.1 Conserved hypothetical protein [Ramlibacter tataouinensis TTB310]